MVRRLGASTSRDSANAWRPELELLRGGAAVASADSEPTDLGKLERPGKGLRSTDARPGRTRRSLGAQQAPCGTEPLRGLSFKFSESQPKEFHSNEFLARRGRQLI
jgi:hypothetical protein